MSDPIEPEFHEVMNHLARGLDKALNGGARPKRNGFVLLAFRFGEPGRCNYISNAERADVLVAMKEFIARSEGRCYQESGTVQ